MAGTQSTSTKEHVYLALIIGAGFGGIGLGCNFKFKGIEDFIIFDKAPSVGGVWYHNTYPNCACDVPSHFYSFSFNINPNWSEHYSTAPEILQYLKDTVTKFKIGDKITLNTQVLAVVWDASNSFYRVQVKDVVSGQERQVLARVVVGSQGPIHFPRYPDIPGLRDFAGPLIHSAKWDSSVPLKGLNCVDATVELKKPVTYTGKRIAVIGNGASAIQIVPALAEIATKLTVFQRTPNWTFPRLNFKYSSVFKFLLNYLPGFKYIYRYYLWIGMDSFWFPLIANGFPQKFLRFLILKNLEWTVKDPVLRAKLTPTLPVACKRITPSDDYFNAIQKPNCELVTDGIEKFAKNGLIDKTGCTHEFDIIILATGYQPGSSIGYTLKGVDGFEIASIKPYEYSALRGTFFNKFPNYAMLSGPNTVLGHNSQVYMMESQMQLIVPMVKDIAKGKIKTFEATREAQNSWDAWIQSRMGNKVWTAPGCRGWYHVDGTEPGKKPDGRPPRVIALFPGLATEFQILTWRVDKREFIFH